MLDFFKPSFWFQKRTSAIDDARVRMEQMSQYNALFHLDPDKIVNAITMYNAGNLGSLAHIIRDLEQHDDKMATCSMKMKASVGRCDWSVQVKDGFKDDERAKRHVEILKRFWSTVSVTDRFKMNERGGIRLLKKQMMEAQSFGYAVHEIVWKPRANGEIAAEFVKLPLWHFENKTGALRFLPSLAASDGVPMAEGEWLVTTGDGVGIPAAICAMAKRMSFQDWLLFSERSGMPIIVGKTGAAFKSDQWNNIKSAIRSIYRDTRVLLDRDSTIEAIDTGHAANIPFPPLVEWSDRAIAALYRGADLATISKGEGTGASLQGDEASMLEQDASENLSEVLHEQVDAFVIRYVTGDAEPLAKIVIEPVTKPDVDTDIKIDTHLVSMGCRLSKADMMQRYGRTEATSDDDVAEQRQQSQPGLGAPGFSGLPNERPDGRARTPAAPHNDSYDILSAFAKDMSPAGKAVQELLNALESSAAEGGAGVPPALKEKASALVSRLPSLLPEDPATAAAIAEAMAAEFGEVKPKGEGEGEELANEDDAIALANERGECEGDDPAHCRVHGVPETRPLSVQLAELGYKDRNDVNRQADGVGAERVAQIVSGDLKEHCKVHEAVAALRKNPTVKNAFGKDVTFGEDMILHYLGGYGRSNNQADAKRLKELPLAMHAVKTCGNPRLQYPKGVAPDPINPPRGTQYVYHEKVGDGDMQCRAWVDSGKVKGWFVK